MSRIDELDAYLEGLDGPGAFAQAADAFVSWCPAPWTVGSVAETLSRLARAGLIVSVELHEEAMAQYAAQYAHVESAANDLVARLEERDERPTWTDCGR